MDTKKIAFLLVFMLVFGTVSSALAATTDEDSRYLVRSSSGFWKNTLGVRNQFKDGFTADLSDWQIRLTKVFGIEIIPVKKLYVLPSEVVDEFAQTDSGRAARPGPAPSRQIPTDQVPWGIEAVYDQPSPLASSVGGLGVNVGVLDTGVFKDHPDLKNRVVSCKDFTSSKQPILDGKCDDKNGHGTHVAGIIAADGGSDGKGIFGVAPQANVFAYKVCGTNGSCWSDDIANAIMHAADNGVNIINLSLGSDSSSSLIKDAVDYAVAKNVLIIAAAGNDGLGSTDIDSIDYPGAYVSVVAVGAFDSTIRVADWSSRGLNTLTTPYVNEDRDVEFAAPGVNIESTWKDGGYAILSGTSMATPHMTGLAAKLWHVDNLVNPDETVRTDMQSLKTDIDAFGDDNASGFGFPNL